MSRGNLILVDLAIAFANQSKDLPGNTAEWLAILVRSGLLRGRFVPPQHFREYRLIDWKLQKLTGIAAGVTLKHVMTIFSTVCH